nr:CarD family transcriptional regulator [Lysinibacillus timonensis]
MYNVGDLIIYSSHGICEIDDITEKSFFNDTKTYYVMHPLNNEKLVINIPINSDKINLTEMVDKQTALMLISTFKTPGVEWIEKSTHRAHIYSTAIKKGDRFEIAKILNTLMTKQLEEERNGNKVSNQDLKLLTSIQNILLTELAIALDTTSEDIYNRLVNCIQEQ